MENAVPNVNGLLQGGNVTREKSPNIHKSCPKMISLEKLKILASAQCDQKKSSNVYKKLPKNDFTRRMIDFNTLQKLPWNVGDLGKFIVAKGFKSCPKSNKSPDLVTLAVTLPYLKSYICKHSKKCPQVKVNFSALLEANAIQLPGIGDLKKIKVKNSGENQIFTFQVIKY